MSVAAARKPARANPVERGQGQGGQGIPSLKKRQQGCAVGMRIGRLAGEPGSRRPERQATDSHDPDQEKPAVN